MSARHRALVVEDDPETAQDLMEILRSVEFEGVIVDNRDSAVAALQAEPFCLVLLDLQIRSAADSIKGHVEHGKALLRQIRERHGEHTGAGWWLPVVVVSGYARETNEAVDVMKDGASDVIQKPLQSRDISERIRKAVHASGRRKHTQCHHPPPPRGLAASDGILVAIPGDRVGRRTRVMIAAKPVDLTDASLKVLLHLMVASRKGGPVNKVALGATAEQGFKGVSNLRNDLKPILGTTNIIKNHYHGDYSFTDNVRVGECAVDKLLQIGDQTISDLAQELNGLAPTQKV